MNQIFDFTARQLKFIVALSITATLMGGYLLLKSNSVPTNIPTKFNITVNEANQEFTGIFVLDPNTAPADSLELIPGIGKTLADRIVAYRQKNRFEKKVDITEVNGIGAKSYEKIKPYLKINKL